MAENSKIEWCDHTFNPWIGCTKVAAGCANCYAEELMDKRYHKAEWGPTGTRVKTSESNWKLPLKWNREAEKSGKRARVFCASLADIFEEYTFDYERQVAMTEWRTELFKLIDSTRHLDWLILTKRPENIMNMWPRDRGYPPGCPAEFQTGDIFETAKNYYRFNVWLGTSVAEQKDADKNIPKLLQCRKLAPVLFLSCEPLISKVDLSYYFPPTAKADCEPELLPYYNVHMNIDWVIAGGESGKDARPMHPDWARSLRDQCVRAGVPFLFKQWGEWWPKQPQYGNTDSTDHFDDIDDHPNSKWVENTDVCMGNNREEYCGMENEKAWIHCQPDPSTNPWWLLKTGKKTSGRLLDGREWNEYPQVKTAST
jgi:protein gp37